MHITIKAFICEKFRSFKNSNITTRGYSFTLIYAWNYCALVGEGANYLVSELTVLGILKEEGLDIQLHIFCVIKCVRIFKVLIFSLVMIVFYHWYSRHAAFLDFLTASPLHALHRCSIFMLALYNTCTKLWIKIHHPNSILTNV